MIKTIPFMPLPYKLAKPLIRGFYAPAALIEKFFPSLDLELEETASHIKPRDYVAGAILTFTIYLFFIGLIVAGIENRIGGLDSLAVRARVVGIDLFLSLAVFAYIMLIPKWVSNKKEAELERNLLFASRHLMIQTSAGVPLFDSIVSISEEYGDPELDYGQISAEFRNIVKDVRGGKDFTEALEESAARNPSLYYRRVIWQLANANRSGADIGTVLKDVVEFLSDEQRIQIRDYGSQLNPLALFYMLACIIAPTMGIVFLMVITTFVDLPIRDFTFVVIAAGLVVFQIMFIGLIKSRRPRVAL